MTRPEWHETRPEWHETPAMVLVIGEISGTVRSVPSTVLLGEEVDFGVLPTSEAKSDLPMRREP